MDDRDLLRLLQKDGDRGLEAALDLYGGLVKTIVSRVLYNFPQDAEECVSDVFLKLWKNRRRLRGAPLRAWLIVAARNAAMGRTADDVNQRLSRGRKRLREQLAKGGTTLYAQKSL